MTPQQFVDTWKKTSLSERSACHSHFLALCELLNQPKPVDADPDGAWYTFERGVNKSDGGHGWADVWKKGHFGWEYKKKRRDLKASYDQLLMYREDLENPPLLVVCDMDRFEIHTNFTGTIKTVYAFEMAFIVISLRQSPFIFFVRSLEDRFVPRELHRGSSCTVRADSLRC